MGCPALPTPANYTVNDNRDSAICILLAGGQGSRLHPLTSDRAKPSVPFGGKYRIIDFTLSNCLHSGIRRVLVLTQYKSHSLQKHLRDAWSIFSPELGEYITAIPPQMRTGDSWYGGTADAIYQNHFLLERSGAERILILSGDHIYRMDYAAMLRRHNELNAELTVACMRVPIQDANAFGVLTIDKNARITAFDEKPANPTPLPDNKNMALASMGIYIFNRALLNEQLEIDNRNTSSTHDFGVDLIPGIIKTHKVYGYEFGRREGRVSSDRYWRDVGTIDSYYDANMDLLEPVPPLNLYQDSWPIRTYHGQHPPARVIPDSTGQHGQIRNSILGSGSIVIGATIENSILSARVQIAERTEIESSIIFDNVNIGPDCKLHRCIIDKHVQIPAGTEIGIDRNADKQRFSISDSGVVKEQLARSIGCIKAIFRYHQH